MYNLPVSTLILLSCPNTASPIFESLIMFGSKTSTLIGFPAVFCSLSKTCIEYFPTDLGQYEIL